MLKKYLSLMLVALLVYISSAAPVLAKSKAEKETQFAERVRASILKLGVGPEALVKIKLRNQARLEGYISEAGTASFVVLNAKSGTATTVAYPQVKTVQGHNLSTGVKIAIGVGIAIAVLAILVLIARHDLRSKL
jgi:hypothetical protein